MPSCSQPSMTLRAAEAVARRRAILDRRCARRQIACVGRDGRMVPIEHKDWTEADRASKLGQNHPLDSTKRHIWQISQQGQNVFGTISISTLEGLDKSTHAFEGTIQDSVLVFRATRWLSPQLSTWCMAAGTLKLDETTAPPELKGTWGANPIPGGCPTGSHGRVQLSRR